MKTQKTTKFCSHDRIISGIALSFLLTATGCKPSETATALHEPNYLYAHALHMKEDVALEQPLSDSQDLLTEWFGTLDEPKLPPLFSDDDYMRLFRCRTSKRQQVHPQPASSPVKKGCSVSFALLAMASRDRDAGQLQHLRIRTPVSSDMAFSNTKVRLGKTNPSKRTSRVRFAKAYRVLKCLCSINCQTTRSTRSLTM